MYENYFTFLCANVLKIIVEAPFAAITASYLLGYDATSLAHLYLGSFSQHSQVDWGQQGVIMSGRPGARSLGSGPPREREKERETELERAYVGWPVLFWLCRVEIITEHGQDVQMFINDQHGQIIVRQNS